MALMLINCKPGCYNRTVYERRESILGLLKVTFTTVTIFSTSFSFVVASEEVNSGGNTG